MPTSARPKDAHDSPEDSGCALLDHLHTEATALAGDASRAPEDPAAPSRTGHRTARRGGTTVRIAATIAAVATMAVAGSTGIALADDDAHLVEAISSSFDLEARQATWQAESAPDDVWAELMKTRDEIIGGAIKVEPVWDAEGVHALMTSTTINQE